MLARMSKIVGRGRVIANRTPFHFRVVWQFQKATRIAVPIHQLGNSEIQVGLRHSWGCSARLPEVEIAMTRPLDYLESNAEKQKPHQSNSRWR